MFNFNNDTCAISLHAGDTGSKWIHATRGSETAWTSADRCLFTVRNAMNEIVMQRIYRLDDQWDLGDGVVLIEFHNNDTDDWDAGDYEMERRYNVSPVWNGTPSTARCVDATAAGAAQMVEGVPVRTVFKGTLHIDGVSGRI